MAGVNNQANIKPLIDAQTSKIDVDNYWRFKNIENKVAESQQVIEAVQAQASNDVESKLTNAVSTITDSISQCQSAISENAVNAALTETAISNKLEDVKTSADFDVYAPKALNSMGILGYFNNIRVKNNVMEKVYSRAGSGALAFFKVNDRAVFDIFIDGNKVLDKQYSGNNAYYPIIPNSIPYLKYKNSIEIFANTNGYFLDFKDWKTT
ncbi:hypothetical protein [Pseudoalteromonas aliena]|uniref:hypothetical protein n=1 Tax=Pseudoalteromonas aliena TaxID=247523 RepID=UPI0024946DEF|nr:hypothetical protein [Pseudoalteromonas aliena]